VHRLPIAWLCVIIATQPVHWLQICPQCTTRGTPYHSRSYIWIRAVVWACGRGQTHVSTIHFTWSTTNAKCNYHAATSSCWNRVLTHLVWYVVETGLLRTTQLCVLCRMRVDPQFIKQLNESPSNRYSFVCSALVNICNCQTHNDRLGTDIIVSCSFCRIWCALHCYLHHSFVPGGGGKWFREILGISEI